MNFVFKPAPPAVNDLYDLCKSLRAEDWVLSCKVDTYMDPGEANTDFPRDYLVLKTKAGLRCGIYFHDLEWSVMEADTATKKLLTDFFAKLGYCL